MKRYPIMTTVALATVFSLPVLVSAQVPTSNQALATSNAGKLDSKTSGTNVRASQLMGLNIQNSQGESVGEIKDLVIDSNTGKIRYAAVTYGGIFGLGDKLFAVPFEAFKVTRNPDDPDDHDDFVMVLDVTKQQLEGAQGFDQDHWPNMADRNMLQDLDKRYNINRQRLKNRDARTDIDLDVDRDGVDVKVDRN
jgi:sporulation protein YlmC with PRC-barrel domain